MVLRTIASAATILCVLLPATAHGQSAATTACNDGTTTSSTGVDACNGRGGINRARTAVLRRAPVGTRPQTTAPERVTQAGTPSSRDTHAEPVEHRGWRWSHRSNDRDEDRRRAEERHRAEERRELEEKRRREEQRARERHDRVRCRDGRYEDVKEHHGRGKGPDVCKHHGGVAH